MEVPFTGWQPTEASPTKSSKGLQGSRKNALLRQCTHIDAWPLLPASRFCKRIDGRRVSWQASHVAGSIWRKESRRLSYRRRTILTSLWRSRAADRVLCEQGNPFLRLSGASKGASKYMKLVTRQRKKHTWRSHPRCPKTR